MRAQVRYLPSAARSTVIVVDDQSTGRAILEQVVRGVDEHVVAQVFERPLDAVVWATRHVADLVLVDYAMPEMDGIEFARRVRTLPGYDHVPIVMVTVHDDRRVRYAALDAGITDFLAKPIDARECLARCRNLLAMRRQQLILEDRGRLLEAMIADATREVRAREREALIRLARAGEHADAGAGHHVDRVARYARLLAEAAGLDREEAESIEWAAPLHDFGKIGLPAALLGKPGALDPAEQSLMREHCAQGHALLKDARSRTLRLAATIALEHHERYDGEGYPARIGGEKIALAARIASVAEVYDVLTTDRPYRHAWSTEDAIGYLRAQRGRQFDPRLVDAFIGQREEVQSIQIEWRDGAPGKGTL